MTTKKPNRAFIAGVFAALSLSACSTTPIAKAPPVITEKTHTEPPTEVLPAPPVVESKPFTTETLYALMVAELAGSRDRLDIMLNNYMQQAIATQDAGITARATHLANFMRDQQATLQMANQWAALDPTNEQARYLAMAALADAGRYFEAFEHGRYLLTEIINKTHTLNETSARNTTKDQVNDQASKTPSTQATSASHNTGHSRHGLDALAVKATSTQASQETLSGLLSLYMPLREQYSNDEALAVAVSFLQLPLEQLTQALANARAAQALKPEYEQAYAQELRVLGQQDPQQAQRRLSEVVALFPNNQRMRLQYARNLTISDLPAAAEQFEELLKQSPNDSHIILALALTRFQLTQLEAAQKQLLVLTNHATPNAPSKTLQNTSQAQTATAQYYLGKIAVAQNRPLDAIKHYNRVTPGKEFLPALARAISLMHEHNQKEQALHTLVAHQLTADKRYQEGISLLLAEHYRTEGRNSDALQALNQGIALFPVSQTLLFNRAMHHVRNNAMDAAEADLQTLITINPDNSDALNTLGYILVDANIRLLEGKAYIERALALDPNNAAAIDSLGWAYFRLGNYDKAITLLRQALKLMPSDEIAAHLGEALWVSGKQKAAIAIWQQGLALNPKSTYIHRRLQQFNVLGES